MKTGRPDVRSCSTCRERTREPGPGRPQDGLCFPSLTQGRSPHSTDRTRVPKPAWASRPDTAEAASSQTLERIRKELGLQPQEGDFPVFKPGPLEEALGPVGASQPPWRGHVDAGHPHLTSPARPPVGTLRMSELTPGFGCSRASRSQRGRTPSGEGVRSLSKVCLHAPDINPGREEEASLHSSAGNSLGCKCFRRTSEGGPGRTEEEEEAGRMREKPRAPPLAACPGLQRTVPY